MCLHDARRDRQPEARPAAARRVEDLEDPGAVLGLDARAVVLDREDRLPLGADPAVDPHHASRLQDLGGVDEDVHDRLADLGLVQVDRGYVRSVVFLQREAPGLELRPDEARYLPKDLVEVPGLEPWLVGPRVRQEVVHEVAEAPDLSLKRADIGPRVLSSTRSAAGRDLLLEHLKVHAQDVQGIADLVGQARRQATHEREAVVHLRLGLQEPRPVQEPQNVQERGEENQDGAPGPDPELQLQSLLELPQLLLDHLLRDADLADGAGSLLGRAVEGDDVLVHVPEVPMLGDFAVSGHGPRRGGTGGDGHARMPRSPPQDLALEVDDDSLPLGAQRGEDARTGCFLGPGGNAGVDLRGGQRDAGGTVLGRQRDLRPDRLGPLKRRGRPARLEVGDRGLECLVDDPMAEVDERQVPDHEEVGHEKS